MEIVGWGILTVVAYYGIIKFILAAIQEKENKNNFGS